MKSRAQFKRALISIPLIIAEGSGKQSGKDQPRFYDMARGSALEYGACLDVMVAMKVVSTPESQDGKAFLIEIAAMLTALARRVAGERTREEGQNYQSDQLAHC